MPGVLEMMYAGGASGGNLGEFFYRPQFEGHESVDVVCEGGCAFAVLIDDYSSTDENVCGIERINGYWQLWLQHRVWGNLEVETIDGSETFGSDEVEDGAPHHILVNANNDVIDVYVDGVIIGGQPGRYYYNDGSIQTVGTEIPVRNFRVWNRFLTAPEIQRIYKLDRG